MLNKNFLALAVLISACSNEDFQSKNLTHTKGRQGDLLKIQCSNILDENGNSLGENTVFLKSQTHRSNNPGNWDFVLNGKFIQSFNIKLIQDESGFKGYEVIRKIATTPNGLVGVKYIFDTHDCTKKNFGSVDEIQLGGFTGELYTNTFDCSCTIE